MLIGVGVVVLQVVDKVKEEGPKKSECSKESCSAACAQLLSALRSRHYVVALCTALHFVLRFASPRCVTAESRLNRLQSRLRIYTAAVMNLLLTVLTNSPEAAVRRSCEERAGCMHSKLGELAAH